MRWDIDQQRLYVQGGLGAGVLIGASVLALHGVITSDAVVGLYSVVLGAVAGSSVGGQRGSNSPVTHTHQIDGNGQTSLPQKPEGV